MVRAVAALAGFIVYGSLYPFRFAIPPHGGDGLAYLARTWHDWDTRGDLLSNILLYLPFGFFLTQALPARWSGAFRTGLALLLGTTLSVGIELAQFFDAGRVTSMGDVYANAIGTATGAVASAIAGANPRWPLVRQMAARPDASLLLVMFLGYRFYPYVPMINMHKYWYAVRAMQPLQAVQPDALARYFITWLFIALLVHTLFAGRHWFLLFPLFALGEFAGRILIVDATLTTADLAGAAAALILWACLLHWVRWRGVIVTAAFAAMVTALRLQPFQFDAVAQSRFGWVPFWSLMHGSTGVAIQAFCEKSYQYGGLIWLLAEVGVPLRVATGLTAALLLATSGAEIYLPQRSAEITDAMMAIGIGGLFLLLRQSAGAHKSRSAAAGTPDAASGSPVSATPVSATPVSATPVSATPVSATLKHAG